MKRLLVACVFGFLCGGQFSVNAQEAAVSIFEIKGLKLGLSEGELKARYPSLAYGKLSGQLGDRKCSFEKKSMPKSLQSIAGNSVDEYEFFFVRPARAHSCRWKSYRKLITTNEAKRNCTRATECGEEAWSETASRWTRTG